MVPQCLEDRVKRNPSEKARGQDAALGLHPSSEHSESWVSPCRGARAAAEKSQVSACQVSTEEKKEGMSQNTDRQREGENAQLKQIPLRRWRKGRGQATVWSRSRAGGGLGRSPRHGGRVGPPGGRVGGQRGWTEEPGKSGRRWGQGWGQTRGWRGRASREKGAVLGSMRSRRSSGARRRCWAWREGDRSGRDWARMPPELLHTRTEAAWTTRC